MRNRKQKPASPASTGRRPDHGIVELSSIELSEIAGGLNPQPLPPRHEPTYE